MRFNSSYIFTFLAFSFLFGFFTYFVYVGSVTHYDVLITKTFQDFIPHVFDFSFSMLSLIGSVEISTIVFLSLAFLFFKTDVKKLVFVALLFALGTLLELSGKLFIYHPSPPSIFFRGIGIIFPSGYVHTNYSYPSGHIFRVTFIIVLVFLYLKNHNKRLFLPSLLLLIFFVAMGVSRIYLGEHWFSDVVGGALLGTSAAFLASGFAIYKRPR